MQVQKDFQLADILWYKIGGTVKEFIEVTNKDDVIGAIEYVKKNNIKKVFVCGQGSNLIFTDDYFDGAVIHMTNDTAKSSIVIDENGNVDAFAGETLDSVIQFGFAHEMIGLEWAGGLPGTVGAAVRGNVGAYGGEIKDSLVSAVVLDYAGDIPEVNSLTNEELLFAYRESVVKLKKQMVVISAKFGLKKVSAAEVTVAKEIYQKNIQLRKDRHPLEYPNCGSVFKNIRNPQQIEKVLTVYPEFGPNVKNKWYGKVATASILDLLGFKGYRIGDAQVSEKHALFIVNLGNAKAKDVLEIIDTIQKKFEETLGFKLETEVEIVK